MRGTAGVDARRRPRLVHRHRRGAVAGDPLAGAECLGKAVAERGEHVLDRVVLVHVEIAARDQLEVEGGVEGEQRQQVVEEADAGGDADPARAVEIEGEPQRRLGRRAGNIGAAARRRPGLGAGGAQDEVVLGRATKRDPDPLGEAADDEALVL